MPAPDPRVGFPNGWQPGYTPSHPLPADVLATRPPVADFAPNLAADYPHNQQFVSPDGVPLAERASTVGLRCRTPNFA